MIEKARPFSLAGLALALVLPIAGCETKEKPPIIDTETPIKAPGQPTTNPVTPATTPVK
jgi:hypothetical protein